jgi:hypothetical protein
LYISPLYFKLRLEKLLLTYLYVGTAAYIRATISLKHQGTLSFVPSLLHIFFWVGDPNAANLAFIHIWDPIWNPRPRIGHQLQLTRHPGTISSTDRTMIEASLSLILELTSRLHCCESHHSKSKDLQHSRPMEIFSSTNFSIPKSK